MTNQYALGYKAGLKDAMKVCDKASDGEDESMWVAAVNYVRKRIAALPVPEVQLPDIEAAVLAEREACAKVCENITKDADVFTLNKCAAAIRARGE